MRVALATSCLFVCAGCATASAASPTVVTQELEATVPTPNPDVEGALLLVSPSDVEGTLANPISVDDLEAASPKRAARVREQIVERARSLVGTRSLREVSGEVPDDCTGLVRLAYGAAGIELMGYGRDNDNGVTAIWRLASAKKAVVKKTLRPGDVLFFRETYDRNRDGRRNDGLTHVAIVEEVLKDGTVVFIHRGSKGVERSRMNLREPRDRFANNGELLNDYLRAKSHRLRAYLAGELYAGAASPVALR